MLPSGLCIFGGKPARTFRVRAGLFWGVGAFVRKKLKVSATVLAFCMVNIHLCPEQISNKLMPYISLTPTLRYQMLTVTNCSVLPIIACRMHFAEQHATLDNVYEIDYAEIVSDTPFDTVMQDLSELLRRLFPRSYVKFYLEFLSPPGAMDCETIASILDILPRCEGRWWVTDSSEQTAQRVIRIAALPGKLPVTVKTTPSPQPPKKRFGQIILSAIDRIEQELAEEERLQREGMTADELFWRRLLRS